MMRAIIILFIFCGLSAACKKYKEDGKTSFKSPCKRLGKRWQLYKITFIDSERDFSDSVIYYKIENGPQESFTYSNMILNFEQSKDLICLGTGKKNITVENLPNYSHNYYELIDKKENIRMDVMPAEHASVYYFYEKYAIDKLTQQELIFHNDKIKAYFKAL